MLLSSRSPSFTRIKSVTLIGVALVIVACSSNTSPTDQSKTQSRPVPTEAYSNNDNKQQQTSAELLADLKQNPQYNAQQQRQMRIEAAYLALNEQQSLSAVAKIVERLNPNEFTTLEQDLQLADLYVKVEFFEQAQVVLERLEQGVLPSQYQVTMQLLAAQIASANQEYLTSLRSLFRLNQLYANQFSEQQNWVANGLIWQNILNLPLNTLSSFKYEFGDEADSWLMLAEIINDFVNQPSAFTNQVNRWYQNHSHYKSFQYLPDNIRALAQSAPYAPTKVALLLPFSGSLAKQAEAIRNGFLAHDDFNSGITLTLIDSNKLSLKAIEEIIKQQNIEFIVGPLVKEKIAEFQSSELLQSIPTLNLNTISESQISPNKEQFFYALAPEDEIEQAVNYFLLKNVENPALIYADNALGRRLAQQFEYQWRQATEQPLESIAFKSKSKLGVAVKELLDVDLSEQRIDEIKKLFGNHIKSEQRSRTDIDAVYIIANSQQTRLIKPFFDVNVSTFGKRLPIYASSRSYVVGETSAEKRDLNGLIFTEMTWMLQDNKPEITHVYDQVGGHNTQLKKLFAFGYDARKLMPILKQLAILPEVTVNGLTGGLQVVDKNRVKRNLQWSQYRQGRVVVLQTTDQ